MIADVQSRKLRKIEPNFHLKVSLAIIYYMGTWPPRLKYRRIYFVYTWLCFVYMLGILISSEIANLIVIWGDLQRMVAGATLLMTNCTHAYKVITVLWQQERIRELLNKTGNKLFSGDNIKYENILRLYTWRGIFHYIAYQSFGAMAVFCWGFTPIADMVAGRSRQLPVEGWYPYNVTLTPAFEITASHQGIAIILACFHNVALDTLITGLITVACCQLAILSRNVASIHNSKDQLSSKVKPDKSYETLKVNVEHSNMIFDFADEIQSIFSTVIFLQFFVNCIIVCLIAFNITQIKVYIPSVLIGMVMYMCCITYQIFIYCWHGNELCLHSLEVAFAAYSSGWWKSSQSFKRGVDIVIARAQNPIVLTAGNVMTLSLHTFVCILRMSYSIFTVLQNTAPD